MWAERAAEKVGYYVNYLSKIVRQNNLANSMSIYISAIISSAREDRRANRARVHSRDIWSLARCFFILIGNWEKIGKFFPTKSNVITTTLGTSPKSKIKLYRISTRRKVARSWRKIFFVRFSRVVIRLRYVYIPSWSLRRRANSLLLREFPGA